MPNVLPSSSLGKTELEVTRLGFGAMEIRGAPRARAVTPKQAETILNAVLDAGINYIDTSVDYGTSEEFIGQFISPLFFCFIDLFHLVFVYKYSSSMYYQLMDLIYSSGTVFSTHHIIGDFM